MLVVIKGNPITGFTVHGPFPNSVAAATWAAESVQHLDFCWWLAEIQPVDCHANEDEDEGNDDD